MTTQKITRAPRATPVYLVDPATETDAADAGMPVASGPGKAVQAVVPNGASISAAIDLGNFRLGRIGCPANIDGATKLSFQVATAIDGTYRDLYKEDGTEYTLTVAANRSVAVDIAMLAAVRFLKVRQGTTGAAVAAAADRTYDLSLLA